MDILQDALNLMIAPDPANLQSVKFTINGTFTPSSPVDGWNSVEVDVPDPVLTSINITENDTYTPPSGVDGYNSITVNVPTSAPAVIESLSITENGTYTAETGVDGYSPITVNVPSDTYIGYIGLYGLKEEEQHIGTYEIITEVDRGTCGEDATYTLYSNRLLEAKGTGAVTELSPGASLSNITRASIEHDITDVGNGETPTFLSDLQNTNSLSVALSNSVLRINDDAFNACEPLNSIDLSDNITYIGNSAFQDCSLTSITIPASVTTIGDLAFSCSSSGTPTLEEVTILSTTPPTIGTDIFNGQSNLTVIYVPYDYVDIYKADSGWSTYASLIQPRTIITEQFVFDNGETKNAKNAIPLDAIPNHDWNNILGMRIYGTKAGIGSTAGPNLYTYINGWYWTPSQHGHPGQWMRIKDVKFVALTAKLYEGDYIDVTTLYDTPYKTGGIPFSSYRYSLYSGANTTYSLICKG